MNQLQLITEVKEGFVFGYSKKVQKLHIFHNVFPEVALCLVHGEFIGKRKKGHGNICKTCRRKYKKLTGE